ncbi:MAG: S-methyl-5-thioribose-1-phosphate isomerase, partial [Actinomycetales bacterium]
MVRTLAWDEQDGALLLLDQTLLPETEAVIRCTDLDSLIDAIQRLAVRGAPALGAAGAYGVALAMLQGDRAGWSRQTLLTQIARLRAARPTAVNLAWGVDRAAARVDQGAGA